MSDNPESPSFNRKREMKATEKPIASFSDVSFWSSKPAKLEFEDVSNSNATAPQMFEEDGAELVPIKALLPDALEFKGLGVNGTVRRYQRSSPIPSTREEAVITAVDEEYVAPPPQPQPKIKRSISKNFVKDAVERELKVVAKKEDILPFTPELSYKEPNIKIARPSAVVPFMIASPAQPGPGHIKIVHNNFFYQPHNLTPLISAAPYLSPRVLESLGRDEMVRQQQQQQIPFASSPPNKNAASLASSKRQTPPSLISAASPTASPSLLDKRGDTAVSSGTLTSSTQNDEEDDSVTEESSHQSEKFWFKMMQIFRSISMAIHTWVTTWPGLQDPRVAALNGKGLLIAVLTFASFDVFLALIKAFPKNFWCCWRVKKWDPVKKMGNVWAIIADHALLLDIVPMFANISLRIYSYRLSELVQNPQAVNSISNNGFSIVSDWANPVYSNFVQLILWGVSIAGTLLFHTILRFHFFSFKYKTPTLGFMIIIKAVMLLLDMCASSLFLYCFLVSLGINIFGTSPDIPLMLSIMAASPIISTVGNSLVNVPLLYAFGRLKKGVSSTDALKKAFAKVFAPGSLFLAALTAFYIVVTAYLLNQLHIITISTSSSAADLVNFVTWNPTQSVVWLISVNFALNYVIGMAFTIAYWSVKLLISIGLVKNVL